MIQEHVLEALDCLGQPDAGELVYLAWERENADDVVFYSNHAADLFAIRHRAWVNAAVAHLAGEYGKDGGYAEAMAECMDRFLVCAFIEATEHYLCGQLGIDGDEGRLSEARKEEIRRLVKEVRYDGNF
jgi:hypothetical protein